MAVMVVGVVFFVAGVAFFGFAVWQRTQVRRVSGVTAGLPMHSELAPASAPLVAAAPAAGAPPSKDSYYAWAPPSRAKGRPVGWYSVEGSATDERFWDGKTWTARRQINAAPWATVPVGD